MSIMIHIRFQSKCDINNIHRIYKRELSTSLDLLPVSRIQKKENKEIKKERLDCRKSRKTLWSDFFKVSCYSTGSLTSYLIYLFKVRIGTQITSVWVWKRHKTGINSAQEIQSLRNSRMTADKNDRLESDLHSQKFSF